jgi:predicted Ser/Thr protein kinase
MSERGALLEELFTIAAELGRDERRSFLDSRCGREEGLRREIESLLELDDSMPAGYLESPLPPMAEPAGARVGEVIGGRYRLVRELGEGGMGVVYAADQIEPIRRRVALKLLKAGVDTRRVIRRFEAERQALAMMDHPNVARVLDAGSTSAGRPFFVMEYIEGQSLTAYCDNRALGVEARLELFLSVCDGVQHAHNKGVIHRDLKPGNIIVATRDGAGVARVIDFGIAKAVSASLAEETLTTGHGGLVGTPEYMSPEQTIGDPDIDTRADVYSLGAVLYELLTGRRPFDVGAFRGGVREMERVIREIDPVRPSLRIESATRELADPQHEARGRGVGARALRGDLDWIILRAMEKDRSRRYDTVSALAADIRRHLRNETVEAGAPTAVERLMKFTRRNRGVVGSGVVVLGVLLSATAATGTMAVRESIASKRASEKAAEARAAGERAESVRMFLEDMLLTARAASERGDNITVREILVRAGDRLESGVLSGEPDVEFEVRKTIGNTFTDMGWAELAIPHYRWAHTFALERFGADDERTLRASALLGESIKEGGDLNEALEVFDDLYHRAGRVMGGEHPLTLEARYQYGNTLTRARRPAEALPVLLDASERVRRVHGEESETYALTRFNIAGTYRVLRRMAEAEPEYLRTIAIFETIGSHTSVASAIRARSELGLVVYPALGRNADAERMLLETAEVASQRLGPEHGETVRHMTALTDYYWRHGPLDKARAWISKRDALLARLYPADSWIRLSTRQRHIGVALAQGDNDWAIREARSALADIASTRDPHVQARTVWDLTRGQWLEVWTRAALIQALINTHRLGEANLEALRLVDRGRALGLREAGSYWGHESERLWMMVEVLQGRATSGIANDLRVIYDDFHQSRGRRDSLTARAADTLGLCLFHLGQKEEGRAYIELGEPVLRAYFGSKNLQHAPSSLEMLESLESTTRSGR